MTNRMSLDIALWKNHVTYTRGQKVENQCHNSAEQFSSIWR